MSLVVGVMSGTSLDGIDCALVKFHQSSAATPALELVESHYFPYPDQLRQLLAKTISSPEMNVDQLGCLDVQLGELIASSIRELLKKANVNAEDILAVGSHGHTFRHRPQLDSPFSWQIGDPNVIAERTGICTVADFRRRDIAAGGQGAPLVPAFHQFVFGSAAQVRVVLNIGGIANVTVLSPSNKARPVFGFDTGPGNALLNDWIERHLRLPYDADGSWAASGMVDQQLLQRLLTHKYFNRPFPKSTGRELFNLNWLEEYLFHFPNLSDRDVQATLVELTASTIADAIKQHIADTEEVFVCGGGAHNGYLMSRLSALLGIKVQKTDELGIPADWVEAMAFAWLAWQTLHFRAGNIPSVTGARSQVVLGAIYPASLVTK